MKTIKFLIGLIFIIGTSGCWNNEMYRQVYIQNKSDKTIYYGVSDSYPDTNLIHIDVIPGRDGNISSRIKKGEQGELIAAVFPLNVPLQLFIFDADTIERTPWDSIVKHYRVLKRYEFMRSDVKKNNWTITYP